MVSPEFGVPGIYGIYSGIYLVSPEFTLKDKSLADLDNLPDPDILANEIIENIEASLESFREIMATINGVGEKVNH